MLLDALVWTLFGVATLVIRDRETLSYIVMGVRALQMVSSLNSMAENPDLPSWARRIYSVLYLFSGDYEMVSCIQRVPYTILFAARLTHTVVIIFPALLLLSLAWLVSRCLRRDERAQYFGDRLRRVALIWAVIAYIAIATIAFEAIACERAPMVPTLSSSSSSPPQSGTTAAIYVMINFRHQQCFVGDHRFVTAAAAALLLLFCVGFPVAMLLFFRRNKSALHDDEHFVERWNFLCVSGGFFFFFWNFFFFF
jgi:hypothetical protein